MLAIHPIRSTDMTPTITPMGPGVPCYLVEWYQPPMCDAALTRAVARLEASAAIMAARGVSVMLLTIISVPSDEVLFGIFAADSAESVDETCDRAGLSASRLATATATSASPNGPTTF
ncbi:DUF4242 domain-containing protein [Mycobacterium sp. smrl_JER01]